MRLTEQHIFYKSSQRYKSLDDLCFLSKNLYNSCLYRIKNEFDQNGKWLRYADLEKEFRNNKQNDYVALPNNSSQQIMMIIDNNLKSYFKALKSFKRNKSAFTGCPKFPNYKHKTNGRNIVVFTCVQFRFKDGHIFFPKKSGILPIKTKLKSDTKIYQVRIIPKNDNYIIEVIYEFKEKINENKNNDYLSIDLGVNNLAACITTKSTRPFIVNGKPLKSINQYYNKKQAEYKSKLGFYINSKNEKVQYGKSNRTNKLTNKRNNKINDYLHKSSKIIINHCLENKIDNIVLGKNTNWKSDVKMRKKNKQAFIEIPFNRFESYLMYKCQKYGLNFICREESYTSKASALDLDEIPSYKQGFNSNYRFSGKRVKRGLYKTSNGQVLNADINGSINILRKEIGDVWLLGSNLINRGLVINPLMVVPL